MASRKVLISVLLVFTYFLGLAHEIIPHAHHNSPGSVAITAFENGDSYHQDCFHFSANHAQFNDPAVCSAHHHHPPLCNDRTLYLPSLAHNLTYSDDVGDFPVFPFLTEIVLNIIGSEQTIFPPDSDDLVVARGPDEVTLRGPPAFSC